MAKIPDCDRCHLDAHSPYLVCSVHPTGPEGDSCADFEAVDVRQPIGGGYYDGDWIPQLFPVTQPKEQQALLDEHPLFTGRCPECEMPIPADPPRHEWHCGHCGWRLQD
jgi:hypothetical protein